MYYAPGGREQIPLGLREKVEEVIAKERCWLSLMSGDLRKNHVRQNFLGARLIEDMASIDGAESFLRVKEVLLYSTIGKRVIEYLK